MEIIVIQIILNYNDKYFKLLTLSKNDEDRTKAT
jgi:hypothetical protein